ncbi:serine hydrolase domain-containing protein [Streptomyces sp. NPDC015032]|uniref:serine hydrolase domain-containing protein n=1 Tax=Streptomyces sp. NPDC015032 TaxID=3364937 RepID=UPI0036F7BCE0
MRPEKGNPCHADTQGAVRHPAAAGAVRPGNSDPAQRTTPHARSLLPSAARRRGRCSHGGAAGPSRLPAPYDTYRSTGPGIHQADRFRAGSITKTFVATVVLQLSQEKRLQLPDTVDRLLPGLIHGNGNDGRRITLRALLDHTSDLYDYTADTSVHPVSATAAVRVALTHRPTNAPGSYACSNTNYVVLGLVVRRVTGHDYAGTPTDSATLEPALLDAEFCGRTSGTR